MIDGLKPYGEYRETGLAWVGKVPAHWSLIPNRGLMRRRKVLVGDRHPSFKLLSLTRKGIIVRDISGGKGKFSSDMGTSQEVRSGDLVFCLFDVPETPRTVGLSQVAGMITGAYTVFECRDSVAAQFLDHFYRSMDDSKSLAPLYSGLRNTIPIDRFLGTKTPLPPPEEQAAIVRFLTWAHRRLDRVVANKRRTIALLNEQKQAIIHRAVTRGLDPNVKLKPSGIPWLGEIPEGWEVRRLLTLVDRIDQGVSPQAVGFLAEGDTWGVLKSGCVNHGVFREREHKQLARSFVIDPSIVVNEGDVLISRACGTPSLVGSVGRVRKLTFKLILCDKTFRPIFKQGLDLDFMVFAMNAASYRMQVEQAISGAEGMANNLPLSSLKTFLFAIPPIDIARKISASLQSSTGDIEATISRLEREVELLIEYHTRLTADVVTGQLDVRQAAAGLPDEVAVVAERLEDDELAHEEGELDA